MPTIVVTPERLHRALRGHMLARSKDLVDVAIKTANKMMRDAEETVSREGIIASAEYGTSFCVVRLPDGAALINAAPHATYVEYGRRPGSRPPPMQAILRWIKLKGIGTGDPAKDRNSAFLIAKKIGRDGIRPQWVMRRVAKRWIPQYKAAVLAALRQQSLRIYAG